LTGLSLYGKLESERRDKKEKIKTKIITNSNRADEKAKTKKEER
jgi:hypothetical protein